MTRTVLLGSLMAERGYIRGPFGSALRRPEMKSEGIPVYEQQNAIYNHRSFRFFIDDKKYEELKRFTVRPGDLVISCSGTLGKITVIRADDSVGIISQALLILRVDKAKVLPEYLYYFLTSRRGQYLLLGASHGSVQTNIAKRAVVEAIKLELPDLLEQKKIVDILGTIDEKIELNRKMNETLEQMGQTLFRHYFITNPDVEKWNDGVLGDIIVNFDSKRKPLSSRQRAELKGNYRYFGATSVMDYINDYLFDGKYLLLAEDGSVIKSDGTPYLQYVWGKFWVNNHAHVLQAKFPFTVEYLYALLAVSNVQSLVSGAVQLKINQQAMNNFRIKLPPEDLVIKFCRQADLLFEQRRINEEQILILTTLHDILLPRLIAGRVSIDKT